MTKPSAVFFLLLLTLVGPIPPTNGQVARLTPQEHGVFNLIHNDLVHYGRTCTTADSTLQFWNRYAAPGTVDLTHVKFLANRRADQDTFFIALVVPPELNPGVRAIFNDTTRVLYLSRIPSSPLVRTSLIIHELNHVADVLLGIIDYRHETSFQIADDERRAYEKESRFLDEATHRRWSAVVSWGLKRRIASYPPLAPDRYRVYNGYEQVDIDSVVGACGLKNPEDANDLMFLYVLAIGYKNIEHDYSTPREIRYRKIELTLGKTHRQPD